MAHGPVQAAVVRADVAPYVPDGHGEQEEASGKVYVPTPHTIAVGEVEPAGHA